MIVAARNLRMSFRNRFTDCIPLFEGKTLSSFGRKIDTELAGAKWHHG